MDGPCRRVEPSSSDDDAEDADMAFGAALDGTGPWTAMAGGRFVAGGDGTPFLPFEAIEGGPWPWPRGGSSPSTWSSTGA